MEEQSLTYSLSEEGGEAIVNLLGHDLVRSEGSVGLDSVLC
jgi:hypothetical protein